MNDLAVIDFETEAIRGPPHVPAPVGVAVLEPGQRPTYYAWGHPTENGIYEKGEDGKLTRREGDAKEVARRVLSGIFRGAGRATSVLGHNIFKFDLPVAERWLGLAPPSWDRVHDTLFSLFLVDPHAPSLGLKQSAERLLGEPPDERNAVFDWLVEQRFIATPKRGDDGRPKYAADAGAYICKAPGGLVAAYAIGDVTRTLALHAHLQPTISSLGMRAAYDRERRLAPALKANEERGLRVDRAALESAGRTYEGALLRVDDAIRARLDAGGLNLDSDADVAAALKRAGVVAEFPKTPTGKDSVSKKVLLREMFSDPRVWQLLYYRNALSTVLTMSLRPWAQQAAENNGYIFTEWNQVRQSHNEHGFKGARSGRVTCSYFQNISKTFLDRGDGYTHPDFVDLPPLPLVRQYLVPDVGDLWGHIDYNQQELRLVAHYEEGALAEAYRRDPSTDIHDYVQKLIKEASGQLYDRRPVKIVNFRTVYGGGVAGLAEHLRIPYADAKQLIDDWRRALPDVVSLDKELKARFRNGQHIRTYGGRVYHCKPPAVAKKGPRKGEVITFEYTALNYLIQPSGADVTKEALVRYDQAKKHGRLIVTVHDEVNISAPAGAMMEELKILKECMESVKLDVPWRTDTKVGESWGSLRKCQF